MPSSVYNAGGGAPIPLEDTPPSTRPSSASSTSSGLPPLRTTSMDSLPTAADKVEHIPTRTIGTGPKVNTKAMCFVKTGPAQLYKSATEQMKKAQTVKEMRKKAIQDDQPDWQQNLDKWKMSRRKRNEDVLERVIEVKKFESENEGHGRRKSKTFSEMREETCKRGRRFNLVVHDDDETNDLSDLGLSAGNINNSNNNEVNINNTKNQISSTSIQSNNSLSSPPSSLTPSTHTHQHPHHHHHQLMKDVLMDQDNKDAKSDAGFCTGSDTGSDGLFQEDNISDTSSALGDKKEPPDSLLEAKEDNAAANSRLHRDDVTGDTSATANGSTDRDKITSSNSNTICSSSNTICSSSNSIRTICTTTSSSTKQECMEYTYDKAIEGYKQYAENSVKRRTSSMTSLANINSVSSNNKYEDKLKYESATNLPATSPTKTAKIGDKLNFFVKEMDKEFTKAAPTPSVVLREKSPKVDITKRRTMFEMDHAASTANLSSVDAGRLDRLRSSDMTASTGSLKNKVASRWPQEQGALRTKVGSFESTEQIDAATAARQRGITPPRDPKFKEKLASFSSMPSEDLSPSHKKAPVKDKNFHQKLASFTNMEINGDEIKPSLSGIRKSSVPQLNGSSLKSKIASFEQLDQHDQNADFRLGDGGDADRAREKSVSMECLSRPPAAIAANARRLYEMKVNKNFANHHLSENSRSSVPASHGRPPRASRSPEKGLSSRTHGPSSPDKKTASSSYSRRDGLVTTATETSDWATRLSTCIPPAAPSDSPPLHSPPPCPPLDLNHHTDAPSISSTTTTDAPISTSSPRYEEQLHYTDVLPQQQYTDVLPQQQYTDVLLQQQYDDVLPQQQYDDVLPQEQYEDVHSSIDRSCYTDEDINEVIDQFDRDDLPRQAEEAPQQQTTLKCVPPKRTLPTVPGTVPPSGGDGGRTSTTPYSSPFASAPSRGSSDSGHVSKGSAKEELRKRRSDFLGTKDSRISDGVSSLLVQQQQETDRQMLEARRQLHRSTQQVLSDIDQSRSRSPASEGVDPTRDRYTWQDRLRDDTAQPGGRLDQSGDDYVYHKELRELEAEMVRHDRYVINMTRAHINNSSNTSSSVEQQPQQQQPTYDDIVAESPPPQHAPPSIPDIADVSNEIYQNIGSTNNNVTNSNINNNNNNNHNNSSDNYYEDTLITRTDMHHELQPPPPQQQQQPQQQPYNQQHPHQQPYTTEHQTQQQQQQLYGSQHETPQQPHQEGPSDVPSKPSRSYATCYDSAAPVPPEPLPRKGVAPAEVDSSAPVGDLTREQQQLLSKQSRQALSATPRTRLTDGESWIRRKPDQTKDYSKHWLIQEAEQRRLEQRPVPRKAAPPPSMHSPSAPLHHSASVPRLDTRVSSDALNNNNNNNSSVTNPPSSEFVLNRALDPHSRTLSSDQLNHNNNSRNTHHQQHNTFDYQQHQQPQQQQSTPGPSSPVNRSTDPNQWRNQSTTYQPLSGGGSNGTNRPLPDAIINSITQRVNNKSRPSSTTNSSGRPSPYNSSMTGSNSNLHYATSVANNSFAATTTSSTTQDENYHDYMNTDALNYPNYQQQQQQQQQHNHSTVVESQSSQQLYANYPQRTSTHNSSNNIIHQHHQQHEHHAQHHQVSNTVSLPLSSSSSTSQQHPHPPHNHHHHHHHHHQHSSPPHSSSPSSTGGGSPGSISNTEDQQRLLSVSGKKKCSHCSQELGRGAAMIIESLRLFYHIPCFVCCVCGMQLGNGKAGADVRVRNHALHCHNCYSNDQGMKFSKV